jgi:hypothetical protein
MIYTYIFLSPVYVEIAVRDCSIIKLEVMISQRKQGGAGLQFRHKPR